MSPNYSTMLYRLIKIKAGNTMQYWNQICIINDKLYCVFCVLCHSECLLGMEWHETRNTQSNSTLLTLSTHIKHTVFPCTSSPFSFSCSNNQVVSATKADIIWHTTVTECAGLWSWWTSCAFGHRAIPQQIGLSNLSPEFKFCMLEPAPSANIHALWIAVSKSHVNIGHHQFFSRMPIR